MPPDTPARFGKKAILETMTIGLQAVRDGDFSMWKQLTGTGRWFDGYWPMAFIGPNGALHEAGNVGAFTVKDTR